LNTNFVVFDDLIMQLFSSLSFQFPTVLTWFFSVLCMLDVGGMPLCNLHVSVRLWRDLVVRPTHVVQITSTTPRPVLPPTQNPDGPRAEALTKPETLRAWLKRIEYEVLVFFSYFYADTHMICSVKLCTSLRLSCSYILLIFHF
jgi:hypothetical protein